MRRVMKTLSLTGLMMAVIGSGCDGAPQSIEAPPPPPRENSEPVAELGDLEPPARFELERRTFSDYSRDPFMAPVREEYVVGGTSSVPERECDLELHPLGMTTVNELRLIGLVTGTSMPRAMFLVAGRDQRAMFAHEGDLIGPQCSQQITQIRDNEVIVTQLSDVESERVQTPILLHANPVEAETFSNR